MSLLETATKKDEPQIGKEQNRVRRRSALPALMRDLQQTAKQIEQASQREEGQWHAALVKYRSLVSMVIPGFERIMMASKVAQEGDNKAFIKSMLGR
jgi:hypothetical protein